MKELEDLILRRTTKKPNIVKNVRVGNRIILTLETLANKIDIMKKKAALIVDDIGLEDNRTEREIKIQEWLKYQQEEERKRNVEVKLGYLSAKRNNQWHEWNEYAGGLVPTTKDEEWKKHQEKQKQMRGEK